MTPEDRRNWLERQGELFPLYKLRDWGFPTRPFDQRTCALSYLPYYDPRSHQIMLDVVHNRRIDDEAH